MLPARSLVRTAQNFRHSAYPSKGAQISLHRASYHSPSRSLGARLWFRKDGTPRSKARGLVIASISSALLYGTYEMLAIIQELDHENELISSLVHIQRVDYDFKSVELTDFGAVLGYFRDLFSYFEFDASKEDVDAFFDEVASLAGQSREKSLELLRNCCEEIHEILSKSKGVDARLTALHVLTTMDQAMLGLSEALYAESDDGEASKSQWIRDRVGSRDSSGKNYETLG